MPAKPAAHLRRCRCHDLASCCLSQRPVGHCSVAQPDRYRRLAQPRAVRVLVTANMILRSRTASERVTIPAAVHWLAATRQGALRSWFCCM